MLRKLLLSVALVAGTLGAVALTTSSTDAAYPSANRQSYHSRAHRGGQRGSGWNTRNRHRHHGQRGAWRGRQHTRVRTTHRR